MTYGGFGRRLFIDVDPGCGPPYLLAASESIDPERLNVLQRCFPQHLSVRRASIRLLAPTALAASSRAKPSC